MKYSFNGNSNGNISNKHKIINLFLQGCIFVDVDK